MRQLDSKFSFTPSVLAVDVAEQQKNGRSLENEGHAERAPISVLVNRKKPWLPR